jgi:hypothetical protein
MAMRGGTAHGAVTMLGQLGPQDRLLSRFCNSYKGLFRHHICGHQGRPQQKEAEDPWRCKLAGGLNMDDDDDDDKELRCDAPLSSKAALAVSIPWDRTISRIWAEANPLVARSTEDTVRFKLSNVRV